MLREIPFSTPFSFEKEDTLSQAEEDVGEAAAPVVNHERFAGRKIMAMAKKCSSVVQEGAKKASHSLKGWFSR